ncbi:MAG: glycosyltransferase family 2 protein [Flavobacteriales bacterium]
MIITGIIIFAIYFFTLGLLIFGNQKVNEFIAHPNHQPKIGFSILIAFRNEEKNIPSLLKSIKELKYPTQLFEFIFINDASTDASVKLIQNELQNSAVVYQIIDNQHFSASPKKDAITLGIKKSQFDWILTTDADCILPTRWLISYNEFISKMNPVFIAAPVKYDQSTHFLEYYQAIENCSLQTVTIGSFGLKKPLLCNGANLAYQKIAFYKVLGFKGNNHIVSGDDIFLLDKMKEQFQNSVHFLKARDATVITKPQETWKSVINQRVRWASKTGKQKSLVSKLLGLVIVFCNLFLVVGSIYTLIYTYFTIFLLVFLVLKIILDFVFIAKTHIFFKNKISVPYFLMSAFCYPFISMVIVLKSIQGNYLWKDRKYKVS